MNKKNPTTTTNHYELLPEPLRKEIRTLRNDFTKAYGSDDRSEKMYEMFEKKFWAITGMAEIILRHCEAGNDLKTQPFTVGNRVIVTEKLQK